MCNLRRAAVRAALLAVLMAPMPRPLPAQTSTYELLQTFSGLLNQIRLNYVDSVTTQHLVRGAIAGMLASLDPHSHFLEHDPATRLDAWRAGHLAFTGIVVEGVEGGISVLAVVAGSPAEKAHVSPGDRIIAVNDTSVAGLEAENVQSRLVGERGTRVRLRLERGPRLEPDTVSLTIRNEDIKPRSITREQRLAGGIGYVRLAEFNEDAGRELRGAIDRVAGGTAPLRIILDLRDNPGGLLEAAADVLSSFLSKGQMAFRTRGRHPAANEEYPIARDGRYRDARLVVLINEQSASAAEAVAGSLQDHDRAVILGRRSFGKALMQQPFLIPPAGDVAWLTTGYVTTPSGRLIQRRYRGLSTAQYYALGGKGGVAADTLLEFRTDAGRLVRQGGGITPDSILPAPASWPVWFLVAADSGLDDAVSDSVALSLPRDSGERAAWAGDSSRWSARLLPPMLERARTRLGVTARVDAAQQARIARTMAARVAQVRWGAGAAVELLVGSDPEIAAAVAVLSRPEAPVGPK
jgi:carboxyl-terminal processing protease